ncbi:carbohydrate ABC transporter permease [Acidaminobacter sp. JC074]|uniref:carbohydrate ABC transporter permease n=1 Tax=Acidaminobacter sp. JC074 TaxID=2530199 RepID=UPI001F0F6041
MKKSIKPNRWTPYLFIAPNFIGFLVFILIPVLFSLLIAFTDFNIFKGLEGTSFIGLKNFMNIFSDEWFKAAFWNNLLFALVTIPSMIFLSAVLATVLNDKVHGKTLMRAIIFIPYISSVVAVAAVWSILYNPSNGVINQALMAIGIENVPGWLGSLDWALPALMIIAVWMGLGYNTTIYMSALQGIDKSIYEAADIDGAGGIQTFFKITLPMLKNTSFFLVITNIIASFQVFGTVNIMTDGGPGKATTVLAHYIYVTGFRYHKMGYASAMAWILLLIIFVVTLSQWKIQKKFEETM